MSVIEIEVANLYFHVTDITSIHRSDFFEVCFLIFYTFPILKFSNMLQTFGKNSSGLEATSQKRPQCGWGGGGGWVNCNRLSMYTFPQYTHTQCVFCIIHTLRVCVCIISSQCVSEAKAFSLRLLFVSVDNGYTLLPKTNCFRERCIF